MCRSEEQNASVYGHLGKANGAPPMQPQPAKPTAKRILERGLRGALRPPLHGDLFVNPPPNKVC